MSKHSGAVSILCIFSLFVFSILTSVESQAATGSVAEIDGTPVTEVLVTFTDESHPENSYSGFTDNQGNFEILLIPTMVGENAPQQFSLDQNYPNPFNPSTNIPYTLQIAGNIDISVYNIMGQKIRTLVSNYQTIGHHIVIWDGRNNDGRSVSSGVYIYRIQSGDNIDAKKMLLIDGGGIPRESTNGFSNRSAAKITGETLYTVSAVKDGYHDYRQEQVSGEIEPHSIILTPQEIQGIAFVPIPGGTFQMGDVENMGESDEKPVHTVTLSPFEMSACEITNAQYAQYMTEALASGDVEVRMVLTRLEVVGKAGWWKHRLDPVGYLNLNASDSEISYDGVIFTVESGKENRPAVWVTWYGAKAFVLHYGFDLPTEAEWEYACRGGQQYMYGTDDGTIDSSKANYNNNIGYTTNVGSYPPNPFGLYDMSGNVFEFCYDLYGEYPSESVINPTGPQSGNSLVIRGGFHSLAWGSNCRSAYRGMRIDYRNWGTYVGFRVVRRSGGVTQ